MHNATLLQKIVHLHLRIADSPTLDHENGVADLCDSRKDTKVGRLQLRLALPTGGFTYPAHVSQCLG